MKLKKFIPFCTLFIGTLALPQPSFAEEKIEVIPIIQSSKGLSGKNFNYLEGKPELRLLKVKIPSPPAAILSTDKKFITFLKLRLEFVAVGEFEFPSAEITDPFKVE